MLAVCKHLMNGVGFARLALTLSRPIIARQCVGVIHVCVCA